MKPNRVAQFTIHELGHFYDDPTENPFADLLIAAGGWTTEFGSGDQGDVHWVNMDDCFGGGDGCTYYVKAKGDNWWYRGGSTFVTDYAMTSPHEDWSDTLAVILMGSDFRRNDNDTPNARTDKMQLVNAYLDTISSSY